MDFFNTLLITLTLLIQLVAVSAKPMLNLPWFSALTEQFVVNRSATLMKTYSGKRHTNDSLIMIYYYDSTIAVTELGPKKLLLSCELIEIFNENEGNMLLNKLSRFNRPLKVSFTDMIKLMKQCEFVDQINNGRGYEDKRTLDKDMPTSVFPRSPVSLLSGIIPGTKWCGTGDIAMNYHDLGVDQEIDRCCRQHDLCPVKLRGYQKKYDLSNESLYTKSHCLCDDIFFTCLKNTNTSASQLMGSVYFNLVAVPCLYGNNYKYQLRAAKSGF